MLIKKLYLEGKYLWKDKESFVSDELCCSSLFEIKISAQLLRAWIIHDFLLINLISGIRAPIY